VKYKLVPYILLISFVSAILCGCTQIIPTIPDVGIPIDGFNTDLKMSFNPQWNKFKVDQDLVATVQLNSNIEVVAPVDFNLQLFVYDEEGEKWVTINNSGQYYGIDYKIDANNYRVYFGFDPIIENDQKEPVFIFVLIYGYEYKNDQITDQIVGAYSTIKLTP
jgi:hypothetical protein